MRWVVLTVAALVAAVTANVRVYDVAPYKCYEGWTALDGYVGQQFVACADTLVYAEFFAGQKPTHSNDGYLVQVVDGGTVLYEGNATDLKEWAYVRADLGKSPGAPSLVRGKTYLLKVSHTGAQPVNYFFDPRNSYSYGAISAGGGEAQPPPQTTDDLVCRLFGVNRPLEATQFGSHSRFFTALAFGWSSGSARAESARSAGIRLDRDGIDMYHIWRWHGDSTAPVRDDTMCWAVMDSYVVRMAVANGAEMLPCVFRTPYWCTSANLYDSENRRDTWPGLSRWASRPPIGLFNPVDTVLPESSPGNPFAVYLYRFLRRYGPGDGDSFYSSKGIQPVYRQVGLLARAPTCVGGHAA
jgi:hypothetical protein